jgi:hypothetical protein
MSGIVEVLRNYGWQMCLAAFIGTLLVGLIKTPINKAIKRKLDKTEADEAKRKKVNAFYDSLVYIGNYLIALLVSVIYIYVFKLGFGVVKLFEMSLQIWLLQNAFYGIWKKLGLKGLLEVIFSGVIKWVKNFFDRDGNGKVTPEEVGETTQEVLTNGKVDSNKLFGKVVEKVPNLVIEVVDEAAKKADVEVSTDTDKAKEDLKTKVIDLTENKIKF